LAHFIIIKGGHLFPPIIFMLGFLHAGDKLLNGLDVAFQLVAADLVLVRLGLFHPYQRLESSLLHL